MDKSVKVSIIVENSVYKQGFISEHGYSVLIEKNGEKVLFDTGQGQCLLNNLDMFGCDVADIDVVALSHNHYDHTGGILPLINAKQTLPMFYMHPDVYKPCYSKRGDNVRSIGLSNELLDLFKDNPNNITLTPNVTEISSGIYLSGTIDCSSVVRTDHFYSDMDAKKENLILDDQFIFIESERGVVLVTGCCHTGIIPTISYLKTLTQKSIIGIIGGFHLIHATDSQVEEIIEVLKKEKLEFIVPLHCTGKVATARIAASLGDRCKLLAVSDSIEF